MIDPRLHAPAVARNRDAIVEVLRGVLPTRGLVLEIASGSGEHVVHFSTVFPRLSFQPSDIDPSARASIDAWTARKRRSNILPAVALDAARTPRPICAADALLCIDLLHVAPWNVTEGLFRQAFDLLQPGGALYLYGPFLREDAESTQRQRALDQSLRARNPQWGLRRLEEVARAAKDNDFPDPDIFEMPGENLSRIFRRI